MRRVLALLAMLLAGCPQAIPINKTGNLTCFYGDTVVFSGTFEFEGEGLTPIEDRLSGNWSLCKDKERTVRCELDVHKR